MFFLMIPTIFGILVTENLCASSNFMAFTNCCWRATRNRSESVCR
jgi:hypothetical protein